MSTRQGERVAQNFGPVRGKEAHSYRAEACGVLSILRFSISLAEFTQMHEPWTGVVATDGQNLLDTLEGIDNVKRRRKGEPVSRATVLLLRITVVLSEQLVLLCQWDRILGTTVAIASVLLLC